MDRKSSENRSRKESVRFVVYKAKNLLSSVSTVPRKAYKKGGEVYSTAKTKFFKKD